MPSLDYAARSLAAKCAETCNALVTKILVPLIDSLWFGILRALQCAGKVRSERSREMHRPGANNYVWNEEPLGGVRMFDLYVIDVDPMMVARPKGVLNFEMAERIVEFVEIKEVTLEKGFNRFCDLTRLEGIQLSSDDVSELANRRRAFNPNEVRVKSAFLASSPLAFGAARMYEQLLNSSRIEVRVFSDLESAADWLAVNPEKLKL